MGVYYTVFSKPVSGEAAIINPEWPKFFEFCWANCAFSQYLNSRIYKNPTALAIVADDEPDPELCQKTRETILNGINMDADDYFDKYWSDFNEEEIKERLQLDGKYIVNHSKKIYMSCDLFADGNTTTIRNVQFTPNPVVFLTANGGDGLKARCIGQVGAWCNDVISIEDEPPRGYRPVLFRLGMHLNNVLCG